MQILQQVSLTSYSTMRLGGLAAYVCEVSSRPELMEVLAWATENRLDVRMIGAGSNIIWRDEGYNGLLIVNRILGFTIFEEDAENIYVTVGAGENWDSVVKRSVKAGLSGIEALSLIPGTCGATPIQNVGAYGQEIAQTLTTIEAYDTTTNSIVTIPGFDCGFGYRTSRFKTVDQGRYFILSLTLHLLKTDPLPPFYPPVANYLETNKLPATAASVRTAVMAIRSTKLPDPVAIGNTGSFFANPIVDTTVFTRLQEDHETVPHWDSDGRVKLSGAWLIEQAGFKDFHDPATGMATWGNQPLVLVNESAKSTAALLEFKQKIVAAVEVKFGVTLEQEPELLPNY